MQIPGAIEEEKYNDVWKEEMAFCLDVMEEEECDDVWKKRMAFSHYWMRMQYK